MTHSHHRLRALALALLLAFALTSFAFAETEGDELIRDGGFDGALQFQLYTESGGSAALSVVDGALQVDVSDIGRVGHAIQPYYDGFRLTQGVEYTLSYDVRSTVPRELYVRIQLNGGDYHAYFEERVSVTEEMQRHSTAFTMTEPTDPAPRFCVNMGYIDAMEAAGVDPASLSGHRVVFDNISLTVTDTSGAAAEAEDPDAVGIRVNQAGYLPDAVKKAVFAGISEDADTFTIVNAVSDEVDFEGVLGPAVDNPNAGETDRVADFTALTQPGVYRIVSEDGVQSPPFSIREGIYDKVFRETVRMLYLQRCGAALDEAHAGRFAHPVCHDAPATVYGTDEQRDVSGGWHDAGDYGRYVVSGAKAVAELLMAHEQRGFTDDMGIPESGDGLDDLMQEAKYELDWMLKMQDESGGVHHKVTCRNFPAFVAPEAETDELILCPVSNTATGDFAAVMAMAARVYAEDWPRDAGTYLAAAVRAWDYLAQHEGEPGFTNPGDIVTGEYPDDCDADERFWAAAELYRTTGDDAWYVAAAERIGAGAQRPGLSWLDVGTYGLIAVLSAAPEGELRREAADALRDVAEAAISIIDNNPYGVDRTDTYEWGSNMGVANTGVTLAYAAQLLSDARFAAAAQQPLDYLLGRNATGYCFVTGIGAKSPEHPHHRPSTAFGRTMPGMLVGGPDNGLDDPYAKNALTGVPAAKCYADSDQSYSTNEVCVYWNSPLILLLASVAK